MTDYPKMDAEIKARWVKALRSGEYVQTAGFLWRTKFHHIDGIPGNCCLGVLARIEGLESQEVDDGVRAFEFMGRCDSVALPVGYIQKIGLDWMVHNQLANMNDNGATFDQIADWIEQNL